MALIRRCVLPGAAALFISAGCIGTELDDIGSDSTGSLTSGATTTGSGGETGGSDGASDSGAEAGGTMDGTDSSASATDSGSTGTSGGSSTGDGDGDGDASTSGDGTGGMPVLECDEYCNTAFMCSDMFTTYEMCVDVCGTEITGDQDCDTAQTDLNLCVGALDCAGWDAFAAGGAGSPCAYEADVVQQTCL